MTFAKYVQALEALPVKELGRSAYHWRPTGRCCAIGAVLTQEVLEDLRSRDCNTASVRLAADDSPMFARALYDLGLTHGEARDVQWVNDELDSGLAPAARYSRVLEYARARLRQESSK